MDRKLLFRNCNNTVLFLRVKAVQRHNIAVVLLRPIGSHKIIKKIIYFVGIIYVY